MDQIEWDHFRKQKQKIDVLRGGRFMIEGMEYHFATFFRLHNERILPNGQVFANANFEPAKHEAVAYINRFGQFFFYTKSSVVRSLLGNDSVRLVPTIKKFIDFRDKQTAHRATDWTYKNDDRTMMQYLDEQFSVYTRCIDNRMIFEIPTIDGGLIFDLLDEHPRILSEAHTVISELEKKL